MAAQFEADKLLFNKWAKAVGFTSSKLSDRHHRDLDDPEIFSVVQKLWSLIRDICQYGCDRAFHLDRSSDRNHGKAVADLGNHFHAISLDPKSPKDRSGQIGHIKYLGELVQKLYTLVPPPDVPGRPEPSKHISTTLQFV